MGSRSTVSGASPLGPPRPYVRGLCPCTLSLKVTASVWGTQDDKRRQKSSPPTRSRADPDSSVWTGQGRVGTSV